MVSFIDKFNSKCFTQIIKIGANYQQVKCKTVKDKIDL